MTLVKEGCQQLTVEAADQSVELDDKTPTAIMSVLTVGATVKPGDSKLSFTV